MNWKKQIYENGFITTIDECAKISTKKKTKKKSQDKIDICLNCNKKKCNGNCKEMRIKK